MPFFSFVIVLLSLNTFAIAAEKSEFPKVGFIKEKAEVCYRPGECGDQFKTWIHRGAQVKVLQEKASSLSYEAPKEYYEYNCARKTKNETCWIKADEFLPQKTHERAVVLKTGALLFVKPYAQNEKGNSGAHEGDIVFVTKKENGFCFTNLAPARDGWIKCLDLAFDSDSIRSSLILQRVKLYTSDSDAHQLASRLIEVAKKYPKRPFYSIIVEQEPELKKRIEEQKKLEADPEYQACSGNSYEEIED